VVADAAHAICEAVVSGEDRAALTAGGDDLVLPEAEAAGDADRSGEAAIVEGAMRLRGVLDEGDAAILRDGRESIHVGRVTVEVNSDDRPGAVSEALADAVRGEAEGALIDICEDRRALVRTGVTEAINAWAGTMTSSPGPMSSAASTVAWMAVVPELVAMQFSAPCQSRKARSKSAT
jgi:hypothetical protein